MIASSYIHDRDKLLQPEDISNAVLFALTSPSRSCPCELTGLLRPNEEISSHKLQCAQL